MEVRWRDAIVGTGSKPTDVALARNVKNAFTALDSRQKQGTGPATHAIDQSCANCDQFFTDTAPIASLASKLRVVQKASAHVSTTTRLDGWFDARRSELSLLWNLATLRTNADLGFTSAKIACNMLHGCLLVVRLERVFP